MDTLFEAKKSFQLELTNAASGKPKLKQHTAAVIDRSKLPNQKFASRGPATIKQEHPAASTYITPSGIITTSNVAFVGQLNDLESRKKRRCEITIISHFLALVADFSQIVICTRRYPTGVKVRDVVSANYGSYS